MLAEKKPRDGRDLTLIVVHPNGEQKVNCHFRECEKIPLTLDLTGSQVFQGTIIGDIDSRLWLNRGRDLVPAKLN